MKHPRTGLSIHGKMAPAVVPNPQSRRPVAEKVRVSVILPTYYEADNLAVIVPRICSALRGQRDGMEIIVVDDSSPDGTQQICRELAMSYPVRLEVRTNQRGLATAVLHGLRAARGSILVVMDADLSHPPEKIPRLVQALDEPAVDFVIGSRYVPGGEIEEGWGLGAWLNSKIATLLARPLTSARDPMAGFFALRRSTFERAAALDPIGYKIGLELIVKCACRGIHEVPIAFRNRRYGNSKSGWRERINYLLHVTRLYLYALRRTVRRSCFLRA